MSKNAAVLDVEVISTVAELCSKTWSSFADMRADAGKLVGAYRGGGVIRLTRSDRTRKRLRLGCKFGTRKLGAIVADGKGACTFSLRSRHDKDADVFRIEQFYDHSHECASAGPWWKNAVPLRPRLRSKVVPHPCIAGKSDAADGAVVVVQLSPVRL